MEKRNRTENGFRNTKASDGRYSTYVSAATADRLSRYCKAKNINRAKFVEQCVKEKLDAVEEEYYLALPKETLVQMLLKK